MIISIISLLAGMRSGQSEVRKECANKGIGAAAGKGMGGGAGKGLTKKQWMELRRRNDESVNLWVNHSQP